MDLELRRQILELIEKSDIGFFCDLVDAVVDSDEMFGEVVDNPYFWVHYVESRGTQEQVENMEPL